MLSHVLFGVYFLFVLFLFCWEMKNFYFVVTAHQQCDLVTRLKSHDHISYINCSLLCVSVRQGGWDLIDLYEYLSILLYINFTVSVQLNYSFVRLFPPRVWLINNGINTSQPAGFTSWCWKFCCSLTLSRGLKLNDEHLCCFLMLL